MSPSACTTMSLPLSFSPGDILAGSGVWDKGEEQLLSLPPPPLPTLILTLFPQREEAAAILPRPAHSTSPVRSVLLTLVALAGVAGLLVALAVALCVRQHARQRDKERLAALGPEGAHGDTTFEYQVCSPRSLLMKGNGRGSGVWVSCKMRAGSWVSRHGLEKPQKGCRGGILNGWELRTGGSCSPVVPQYHHLGGSGFCSVLSEVVMGHTQAEQPWKG